MAGARIWKWVMGEKGDELDAVWSHELLSSPSKTAEPASCPPTLHTTAQHREIKKNRCSWPGLTHSSDVSRPNDALSGSGA